MATLGRCVTPCKLSFIHSRLHLKYSLNTWHVSTPVPGIVALAGTPPAFTELEATVLSQTTQGKQFCFIEESNEVFKSELQEPPRWFSG